MPEQISSPHTQLALPAQLTIENVEQFFDALRNIDTKVCSDIVLDAKNLKDMTTPGLQLLVSYARTLEKDGKQLKLRDVPSAVVDMFNLYGLGDQINTWSAA